MHFSFFTIKLSAESIIDVVRHDRDYEFRVNGSNCTHTYIHTYIHTHNFMDDNVFYWFMHFLLFKTVLNGRLKIHLEFDVREINFI